MIAMPSAASAAARMRPAASVTATTLLKALVLDRHRSGPGPGQLPDRALQRQRIAKAGVAVDDQGDGYAIGDLHDGVDQFRCGDQSDVGSSQTGHRETAAAQKGGGKTGLFDKQGAEAVIASGNADPLFPRKKVGKVHPA
jgi:hypothetical protein